MSLRSLRQIQGVFLEVSSMPSDQQPEAIERLCGSDLELRREVLSLLRHANPPDGFLAEPILGASMVGAHVGTIDDALIGTRVGPYQIESRLGAGGMARVYLAKRADGEFDKSVAIKIVRIGLETDDVIRRFREERNTLATLNHPSIACLHDGGVLPDGRPYLVMEHVHGVPIHQYCDEHQLDTRARLRLFLKLCEPVRVAHHNLIVHRDLKPANILITAEGIPKLLDFGIAKMIGDARSGYTTQRHERRFTPEYASPEQVRGDPLSTATDIYSLGVILYELLTGRRPYKFDTLTTEEILREFETTEPAPPSVIVRTRIATSAEGAETSARQSHGPTTHVAEDSPERLSRRLSGDLDVIVLKAMHRDPARRYSTVEQFAADIERHLNGHPVLARPDSATYRFRKFVGRHPIATISVTVLTLAVFAVLFVVQWAGSVARDERDAAQLARDQATETANLLEFVLTSANPRFDGPDTKVRDVLESASLAVADMESERPLLAASVRGTIGRTYLALGMLDEAERNIHWARDTRRQRLDSDHPDLDESNHAYSMLLYSQGRLDEAEALLREMLDAHIKSHGEQDIDTSRVLNDLGVVLRRQGKQNEAHECLQRALDIRRSHWGENSLDVAETLNNLAILMFQNGQLPEAETALREVIDIRKGELHEDHALVAQSMGNLATVLQARGDLDAAEAMFREVIAFGRRAYGPEHPALATDLSNFGRMLTVMNRCEDATSLFRESLDIRRTRYPEGHPLIVDNTADLGRCLARIGRLNEAEPLLNEALHSIVADPSPDSGAALASRDPMAARLLRIVAAELEAVYAATNRPDDASRMHELVDAIVSATQAGNNSGQSE
ncbi:MAG: serine/threonine protein kinase [Phycisphaerales bacterium]|nr:serine/threonine protein kinase [Phycisphaerales bacterium]MCB9862519.1 serine/threonine protein kinase [Phycisphaerales bacterium]